MVTDWDRLSSRLGRGRPSPGFHPDLPARHVLRGALRLQAGRPNVPYRRLASDVAAILKDNLCQGSVSDDVVGGLIIRFPRKPAPDRRSHVAVRGLQGWLTTRSTSWESPADAGIECITFRQRGQRMQAGSTRRL